METKYGKLVDGQIVYAPNALESEGGVMMNPSEESYLAAGWKRVVEEPPEPQGGCTVEPSAWTETETTLTRTYKQVPKPAAPEAEGGGQGGAGGGRDSDMPSAPAPVGKRIFSKLKLVAALKAADKWVLVKTWLEEKAYYDYYLAAQNFAEDNALFVEGRTAIKNYLGMTDEQIEAILSQCVAD